MASNTLSPAIITNEIDLTNVVPTIQSSTGAFAGNFAWGPVGVPQLIGDEAALVAKYGNPRTTSTSSTVPRDFYTAAQFLSYSGRLYVNRIVDTAAGNAAVATVGGGDGTGLPFNDAEAEAKTYTNDALGSFHARYPGSLGNSIKVAVFSAGMSNWSTWNWRTLFDGAPGTSPWLEGLHDSAASDEYINDEVHVVVIDADGRISGVKGTILETYAYLSVALGAKTTEGSSNYWRDVINDASSYIRVAFNDTDDAWIGTNWGTDPLAVSSVDFSSGVTATASTSSTDGTDVVTLSGGVDSGVPVAADYLGTGNKGFSAFTDPDTITVDLLIAPGAATSGVQLTIISDLTNIATTRKDCVVISSPDYNTCVIQADPNSTIKTDYIDSSSFSASSYLVMDNNWLKVLDKYNDKYIWIPASSTTAGIMAATDLTQGPWYSPAGQKRGEYFGIVDIAYNAVKTERDTLYSGGINPIVNLPGRGVILYGDKTRDSRPSAFNRINVRRLFLTIERNISIAARAVMFEFNDEFTRAEFVNIVEPYLREIQGRRGITDFVVQCDETNNTPAVIDRNELVASIFVKPARSVNFVTLNFVAVRTGVDFEEVVGTV